MKTSNKTNKYFKNKEKYREEVKTDEKEFELILQEDSYSEDNFNSQTGTKILKDRLGKKYKNKFIWPLRFTKSESIDTEKDMPCSVKCQINQFTVKLQINLSQDRVPMKTGIFILSSKCKEVWLKHGFLDEKKM